MSKRIISFACAAVLACAAVASAQVAGVVTAGVTLASLSFGSGAVDANRIAGGTAYEEQLAASGYNRFIRDSRSAGAGLRGTMQLRAVALLEVDRHFAHGCLYNLHTDVGAHLRDYRSYRGAFGKGSLHVVIDTVTGAFIAHVDWQNPYEDVVGFLGHLFGEVVPNLSKDLLNRFAGRPSRALSRQSAT